MGEFNQVISAIAACRQRCEHFAVVTVVHASGATYRRPGARAIVTANGQVCGVVTGGCLQRQVIDHAQDSMRASAIHLHQYDTTRSTDPVMGSGTGCAGKQELLFEPHDLLDPQWLTFLMEWPDRCQPIALATVYRTVGNPAIMAGQRIAVGAIDTVNDAQLREHIVAGLAECDRVRQTRTAEYVIGDSRTHVLLEYLTPPVSLVIFGSGDDVPSLAALASHMHWKVRVVMLRDGISPELPDTVASIRRSASAINDDTAATTADACVVMTHNVVDDAAVVSALLDTPCPYIAVLGPKRRQALMFQMIRDNGRLLSADDTARIYSPAGLDIGAESPDEIALSIVAEIQAVYRRCAGGQLRRSAGPIHSR